METKLGEKKLEQVGPRALVVLVVEEREETAEKMLCAVAAIGEDCGVEDENSETNKFHCFGALFLRTNQNW